MMSNPSSLIKKDWSSRILATSNPLRPITSCFALTHPLFPNASNKKRVKDVCLNSLTAALCPSGVNLNHHTQNAQTNHYFKLKRCVSEMLAGVKRN